jgi:hypothetical protein
MSRVTDTLISKWNAHGTPTEIRLMEALQIIERMHVKRLEQDRKIHNQRVSLRENWEVVEMRRKWLGSDIARKSYLKLLKSYRELEAKWVKNSSIDPY